MSKRPSRAMLMAKTIAQRGADQMGAIDALERYSAGAEVDEPKAGDPDVGVSSIAIALIDPDPNQPRKSFEPDSIKELADTMRGVGLIHPIVVRPRPDGRFQICVGERRYRAAKSLGWTHVDAIVRPIDDDRLLAMQLVENLRGVREEVSAIEEAGALLVLEKRWGSASEVARRLELRPDFVAKRLALLRLPADLQSHIQAKRIADMEAALSLGRLCDISPGSYSDLMSRIERGEGVSRSDIQQALSSAKDAAGKVDGRGGAVGRSRARQPLPPELRHLQSNSVKVLFKGGGNHATVTLRGTEAELFALLGARANDE